MLGQLLDAGLLHLQLLLQPVHHLAALGLGTQLLLLQDLHLLLVVLEPVLEGAGPVLRLLQALQKLLLLPLTAPQQQLVVPLQLLLHQPLGPLAGAELLAEVGDALLQPLHLLLPVPLQRLLPLQVPQLLRPPQQQGLRALELPLTGAQLGVERGFAVLPLLQLLADLVLLQLQLALELGQCLLLNGELGGGIAKPCLEAPDRS